MKKKIILIIVSFVIIFIISIFLFPVNLKKIDSSTLVYDINNIEIGEIIKNKEIRHRFININDIPIFTQKAIVLIEDKSFYTNIGIDFVAILRAFINNIKSKEIIEGASTISTQVIRNSYWLNKKRTYFKKISEFYLAMSLNIKYSKNEILENYLNNIYFGYLNYGINSAAKFYFNKDINNLTKAEQIAILILPKNPVKFNPYKNEKSFKNRFYKIVNYLNKQGLIKDKELDSIKNEKLIFNYNRENKLPYVIDYLNKNKNKNTSAINTTLDYNLTKKIDSIAKNVIYSLAWKDVGDYGIIITDKKTNKLKVMIGGIDYYSENGQVNSTLASRQVGSTIKPFTYALAFKDLNYSPSTSILDLPISFVTKEGNIYSPKNYSLDYKGEISLAEALSQSINIPAIKLVNKIGLSRLYNFLKELKITSLNENMDHYGLALTLGVGEMNLFELLQAYSIFAFDGKLCDISILKEEKLNCKKVIEKKYTDMVYEILTNRYFKLAGFPINSNLDFENKEIFVKTGTSRNFRDNWTIGFSENYMIGVWVGNKDGTYMKGVSGSSGAGEIFKNIISYLEKDTIIPKKIIYEKNEKKYAKIISPISNSIYEININKTLDKQKIKLLFNTNIIYDEFKWFINNQEYNDEFFELKKGIFSIKLKLFKNGEIIKNDESIIEIQ